GCFVRHCAPPRASLCQALALLSDTAIGSVACHRACRRWSAHDFFAPVSWRASWLVMAMVLRRGERTIAMTNTPSLPHHRLHVFGFAREMLVAVRDAHIRDAKLRDEALRSAKGMCLNIAEGAGRVTRADKAR